MTPHFTSKSGAALGLVAALLAAAPARAETTLWLVRPLYPGQEALVEKTRGALDRLMPGEGRKEAVIGKQELAEAIKDKRAEQVPCFSGDERCPDPIDRYVTSLGFQKVVLILGGQDEGGYTFKVTAYDPATGKMMPAEANSPVLETALLGAVARVVPVAATLEVKSSPAGATVFVDDVKVGVTPLSTQVIPGERQVRVDLKLHQPAEELVLIPIRGSALVEKKLEKVAARILITATPPGATISIDGAAVGKDRIDRGIEPGKHTIRLTAEGHKAFEQTIDVKADQQYSLDKSLEPLAGPVVGPPVRPDDGKVKVVVVEKPVFVERPPGKGVAPPVVAPPPPPSETDLNFNRKTYFQFSYEYARFERPTLVGRRWGNNGTGRTERFSTTSRQLMGGSMEYGAFGKYFGLTVVGVSYLTNVDNYGMTVGFAPGTAVGSQPEIDNGVLGPTSIDPVKLHLVTIRAVQPQLRIAVWKLMITLQGGLAFRTGQIVGTDGFYRDGFMPLDLLAEARGALRAYLFEGLFIFGAGNYSWFLLGEKTDAGVQSAGTWGFNAGLGYGF